ncbi:uncharacterized protein AB675_8922 [Cyphellophora attinorum]|uniref:Uncharacterized protein n=1 Tax=Cyphellophora attinorum TaxID=1664694 RepID=A0A0N1HMU1_9EURO|nr:uncharacterized protein AB675_8922 [Phialophora attinorum]KPI36160.1 hypothetical protein AB675_8922 [Phialophora attinorum]
MEWSFASAMAGMSGPADEHTRQSIQDSYDASETTPTNVSASTDAPPSPMDASEPGPEQKEENEPSPRPSRSQSQTRARATLDWSFDSAMLELNDQKPDPTPETTITQQPAQRVTPSRPAALTRMMTMPVTSNDFTTIENDDTPPYQRPATAMSDAMSITSSTSSADVDPFGLDNSSDSEMPGPATLEADTAPHGGIGGYYVTRGRTILPDSWPSAVQSSDPASANHSSRTVRIGDENFPGPAAAMIPPGARLNANANAHAMTNNASISSSNSSGQSTSSVLPSGPAPASAPTRPTIEFPNIHPPNLAALSSGATNEELATELERLLEGFSTTLEIAAGFFAGPGVDPITGVHHGSDGYPELGSVTGSLPPTMSPLAIAAAGIPLRRGRARRGRGRGSGGSGDLGGVSGSGSGSAEEV